MGLFEQARNLVDAQLAALLEPGAHVPEEQLRGLILDLDAHRRKLARTLAQKVNEEAYIAKEVAEKSARLALWKARAALARERERADLGAEADLRVDRAKAERGAALEKRDLLASAIASLTVRVERVDHTLLMLREKRLAASSPDAAGPARVQAAAASAVPAGIAGARAGPALDPIEEEFLRLEHEEVARHTARRKKPPT